MELRSSCANALGELGLDVHVNIFKLLAENKISRFDVRSDFEQASFDLAEFFRRENARPEQGPRVCDATLDVLPVELPVHMH